MDSLIVWDMGNDIDISADEPRQMKRKISMTRCEACGTEEAKYRCPGCHKHSCSLPCVKRHKSESGCSGVRDKTAFVPLSQLDQMNILSDYRFLEDAGRLADSVNRDFKHLPLSTKPFARILRQGAAKFNVDLKLLPNGFTKRKENSTYYCKRNNQFLWHLKLHFPQSDCQYTERRTPQSKTLSEILSSYIHPTDSDPIKRQKLKAYVRDTLEHVRVFMKVEWRKAKTVRYHELDLKKTLADNLRKKTVIEYPELHVVLRAHSKSYILLEQDVSDTGSSKTCTNLACEKPESIAVRFSVAKAEERPLERSKDDAEDDLEEGEIKDGGD